MPTKPSVSCIFCQKHADKDVERGLGFGVYIFMYSSNVFRIDSIVLLFLQQ